MKALFITAVAVTLLFIASPAHAQHSASFSWQASPTPGIAGYNVYRAPCTGTVSGNTCTPAPAAASYVKLNSAPITGTTYTDSTIQPGQKYDWYATAVCPTTTAGCGNGITGESNPSNRAAGTVPTDRPQPPSNFSLLQIVWNFIKRILSIFA